MKIKSDILRTYQNVHTWTGIVAGLFLFIGFFAGSITMFRSAIDDWATPPSYQLPQTDLASIEAALPKVLANYPEAQKELVISFENTQSPFTWYSQGGGRGLRLDDQTVHATVDEQGEIITQDATVNELSGLVDMLHRTGGILGEVAGHHMLGEFIMGFAALLYFIALVSGIIFLLPTLTKSFFALRSAKGANRFWLDSHNLVGIASLPFHIIIAFTAVVFAFHDFFYAGLSQVYGDNELFPSDAPNKQVYALDQLPTLSDYFETAATYAPGYQVSEIRLSGLSGARANAAISLVNENEVMRGPNTDFIFMHPFTLDIQTSSISSGDQGVWVNAVSTYFALHFGSYGGNFGRWLYFVMGLAGAFLFYTGNLLWLEKRRQKQGKQTKSVQFMAKLTIGVCLGSLLGVISCFALTKWLSVMDVNINHAYMWIYYSCFIGALVLSYSIGAAKATISLIKVSIVACLWVPITSIIAIFIPSFGIWPASGLSQIGIELFALLCAFIYFKAHQKCVKRFYSGEQNSIWALANQQTQTIEVPLTVTK